MGFKSCKEAMTDSFPNLDLQRILFLDENRDIEEEEAEEAEEGEAVSSEAPVSLTIEWMEPIVKEALSVIEEALPVVEEAKVAVEILSEVIPLGSRILARDHIEVPSSSCSQELSNNVADMEVAQASA